ncbi:hypothetical protein B0J18DRAFT_163893 [Chaetomium sp. MPI-SDFR-AT-0129]|nr:hypothetical protein B0J18DRAFT_163893 [Chaetomium sp. MPI-SDFR-AT-0129]
MTYGYDSAVVFAKSKMGVSDFAADLLNRLRLARMQRHEQSRPFIAICHSLGGVVFKEMLIQATLNSEEHANIAQHIKGVVFLGTPHRGSRSASHAQLISRIINMASLGRGVRTELLRTLEISSGELETISRHAVQLLSKFPIVSFYERKPLGPSLVVESFSAILGLPNERSVPINADHRKMARVSPRKENRYLPVWAAVKELAEAPEQPQPSPDMDSGYYGNSELLGRLFCVDYTNAQLRSAQAHEGTCDWIFHDPTYLSWVNSMGSRILLFSGGPGTGKSVMTRFLVETVLSGSDQSGFALGYQGISFFCSYLDVLQTGAETVLRSLLHQLLQVNPRAEALVKNRLQRRTPYGLSYSFDKERLWGALREVLAMDTMGRTFIAIDALEELGPTVAVSILGGLWEIMTYLAKERPRHWVRVFASSRHNPTYASTVPSLSVLRVPLQKVSQGIKIYLQDNVDRLAATNTGFNASADQATRFEIVNTISDRANGMFLWARIVWDDFRRGLLWNEDIVRQRLAKINKGSSSITSVYDKLMDQIDPSVQDEVWLILSILSIAARPMRMDELAIVLGLSQTGGRVVRSTDLSRIQGLENVIAENLPDITTFHDDHTVSFSHFSFEEYLRTTWKQKHPEILTRAERVVARTCLQYVKLRDLLEDAADEATEMKDLKIKYPFLAYSRAYLYHHLRKMPPDDSLWLLFADLAGKSGPFYCGLLGDELVWIMTDRYSRTSGSPLLAVLDINSVKFPVMETLIRNFAAHGYDMNEFWQGPSNEGGPLYRCCWALSAWPAFGDIAILLLRLGADPRLPRGKFKSGLEYVVEAGRWDVFDVMVSHPRFDAAQQDGRGRCLVHYLVGHATSERLERLLEDVSVDPNIQDSAGDTPIHLAASAGNTAMVRALLNVPGIRLDLTDSHGRTPLGVTTYWGMQSTALCFLEHSQAFPIPEEGQLSALCFAAKHGDRDLCLRLLEKCHYEHLHLHVDASGKGILHLTAMNDWSDILHQCLRKGDANLNVNHIDHSGGTALHAAARLGNTASCRVLVEHGANLQLQDRLGRTAAQVVADAGFRDTTMVLLRSGRVDPNQRDHQGRNLVHWAATLDCVDVMELVLASPGVELARHDSNDAMPIDIAKRCMSARVGKYLSREMQRRGIQLPYWCVGFRWDMLYNSPEVEAEEEREYKAAEPLGSGGWLPKQQNGLAEWMEIHSKYPEELWGLCVVSSQRRERDSD